MRIYFIAIAVIMECLPLRFPKCNQVYKHFKVCHFTKFSISINTVRYLIIRGHFGAVHCVNYYALDCYSISGAHDSSASAYKGGVPPPMYVVTGQIHYTGEDLNVLVIDVYYYHGVSVYSVIRTKYFLLEYNSTYSLITIFSF